MSSVASTGECCSPRTGSRGISGDWVPSRNSPPPGVWMSVWTQVYLRPQRRAAVATTSLRKRCRILRNPHASAIYCRWVYDIRAHREGELTRGSRVLVPPRSVMS
jgi:hypothetical protein